MGNLLTYVAVSPTGWVEVEPSEPVSDSSPESEDLSPSIGQSLIRCWDELTASSTIFLSDSRSDWILSTLLLSSLPWSSAISAWILVTFMRIGSNPFFSESISPWAFLSSSPSKSYFFSLSTSIFFNELTSSSSFPRSTAWSAWILSIWILAKFPWSTSKSPCIFPTLLSTCS